MSSIFSVSRAVSSHYSVSRVCLGILVSLEGGPESMVSIGGYSNISSGCLNSFSGV